MNNIYTAIMRAADHIEKNPHLYAFCGAVATPREGERGCMIGRIAFLAGERPGQCCGSSGTDSEVCERILGVTAPQFFERALDIYYQLGLDGTFNNPRAAVAILHEYARRYHSDSKPGLPASVLGIFNGTVVVPLEEHA